MIDAPAAREGPEPTQPPKKAVPRWHIHRRMYDWMLSFSHRPSSTVALAVFSFCEAIFFPIPPVILQVPMTLERREKTWWYAFVSTASSVVGGLVGYLLGTFFSEWVRGLFSETSLKHFEDYTGNIWLLSAGAIAVHPYKLFAIAAGIVQVPIASFVIASALGRGALFFGVALLLWLFGAPVKILIEKYFNLLTIIVGVAIIAVVVFVKALSRS